MSIPLILSLPAQDVALQEEIEQRLSPYAEIVRQPPTAFDLETIKLVVEITAGAVGVIKTLLEIRKLYSGTASSSDIKVGRLGEQLKPLAEADEALLQQLLEVH